MSPVLCETRQFVFRLSTKNDNFYNFYLFIKKLNSTTNSVFVRLWFTTRWVIGISYLYSHGELSGFVIRNFTRQQWMTQIFNYLFNLDNCCMYWENGHVWVKPIHRRIGASIWKNSSYVGQLFFFISVCHVLII